MSTQLDEKVWVKPKIELPKKYKIILHNNNYTLPEAVTDVIVECFGKSTQEAHRIMLTAHTTGQALCGVYSKSEAELKLTIVEEKKESLKETPLGWNIEHLKFSMEEE